MIRRVAKKEEFLKFLVVTHSLGLEYGGPAESFKSFLIKHGYGLCFISIPLNGTAEQLCRVQEYQNGVMNSEKTSKAKRNKWFSFLGDVKYLSRKFDVDIVISFNSWSLLLFRLLHPLCRKYTLVLWCVDFVPSKYSNKILDFLYRSVEELALFFCDVYVDNNKYAMKARISSLRKGFPQTKKKLIVPITNDLQIFKPRSTEKDQDVSLGYIGRLDNRNGAFKLVPILLELERIGIVGSLEIVGKGELESEISNQIAESGISNRVRMHGHLNSQAEIDLAFTNVRLALAPYTSGTFSKYADPGKLVTLTALGIPCLVSNVPLIVKDYEQYGAVKLIGHEAEPNEWAAEIAKLFKSHDGILSRMSNSAINLSQSRRSEIVFAELIAHIKNSHFTD
jgi:glycosyltransferase involved in cell wall biosynthesis